MYKFSKFAIYIKLWYNIGVAKQHLTLLIWVNTHKKERIVYGKRGTEKSDSGGHIETCFS